MEASRFNQATPHAETREVADSKEILEAVKRTLASDEYQAFMDVWAPGIPDIERRTRAAYFNSLSAGRADTEETLAEREYSNVAVKIGGTSLPVSRNMRGVFQIEPLV